MERIPLELLLKTGISQDELKELLGSLVGPENLDLVELDPAAGAAGIGQPKVDLLGQILLNQGAVSPEILQESLDHQKRLGEILVETGVVGPTTVEAALAEQRRQKEIAERRTRSEVSSSIRVSSLKLDKLVNLIGELVTVQERLSQVSSTLRETRADQLISTLQACDLTGIAEEVSRLTNGLRDNALSIRMLPIGGTFSKFKRLVHDLSSSLGKEIDLVMEGSETEIDKTVIDRLDEPLIHLVRNSADHGMETPDTREAAGKPRKGTITLAAEHSGGNVLIRVVDDGGGLDRAAILRKAEERKLIPANAELSDKEVYALIFLPGFSTAAQVTNVSGRGVGMDVVKKTIEDLRGTVEVSSSPGKGTQIDITLPLTLAIIDGLLVTLGPQAFIIPLSSVEECIELRHDNRDALVDKNVVNVRSHLVPFVPLRERFGMSGEAPPIEQIVVTRFRDQKIGLVVDRVIGEHKTVIKPLGRIYQRVPEFSGATILGDGSIAIILDVGRIMTSLDHGGPALATSAAV